MYYNFWGIKVIKILNLWWCQWDSTINHDITPIAKQKLMYASVTCNNKNSMNIIKPMNNMNINESHSQGFSALAALFIVLFFERRSPGRIVCCVGLLVPYSEHAHFEVINVNQNNLTFFNGRFQYDKLDYATSDSLSKGPAPLKMVTPVEEESIL